MLLDLRAKLENNKKERRRMLEEVKMMHDNIDEFIDFNRAKKVLKLRRKTTFDALDMDKLTSPLIENMPI